MLADSDHTSASTIGRPGDRTVRRRRTWLLAAGVGIGVVLWMVFTLTILGGHSLPDRLAALAVSAGLNPLRGHGWITISLAPDGNRLLFTAAGDGLRDLFLLDLQTLKVSRVARTDTYEELPSWCPDGKRLVYAAAPTALGATQLFVRDLTSAPPKQLTRIDGAATAPAVSPDGQRVYFIRGAHRQTGHIAGYTAWDLWVVNMNGTGLRRLTNGSYLEMSAPSLSPDERVVVFSATQGYGSGVEGTHVYECALDRPARPRNLTARLGGGAGTGAWNGNPRFTPDGQSILFVRSARGEGGADICRMGMGQGTVSRLTTSGQYCTQPVATPDGRRILILGDAGLTDHGSPLYGLWELDENGAVRVIAEPALFDVPSTWKPSGRLSSSSAGSAREE
jgi:Tol biopolymer transport system component